MIIQTLSEMMQYQRLKAAMLRCRHLQITLDKIYNVPLPGIYLDTSTGTMFSLSYDCILLTALTGGTGRIWTSSPLQNRRSLVHLMHS